jgi:hypothetical protein
MKIMVTHSCGHTLRHTTYAALTDARLAAMKALACPECGKAATLLKAEQHRQDLEEMEAATNDKGRLSTRRDE